MVSQKSKFTLVGRYWRTLSYLKTSQIFWQLWLRLRKLWWDPARILNAIPTSFCISGNFEQVYFHPPCPNFDSDELVDGRFTFINQTASLGRPVDWSAKGKSRLWRYNLHYFDWLWPILSNGRKDWDNAKGLIEDWIDCYPPTKRAEGWEPYPTSLRLINWSILVGVYHRENLSKDPDFKKVFLSSITLQTKWLKQNLETHLLGNHFLENLVALWVVTQVFRCEACLEIERWVFPKLEKELEEQVLLDGMHFERSPMYHLRILWLVETMSKLASSNFKTELSEKRDRMIKALTNLRHPDGEIALFNDAALGVYLDSWTKAKPKIGSWSLPDAGYYGYRSSDGDYVIIDAGALGPEYQPGHAHADYLSFELSLNGRRVITDTGVGTYQEGRKRSYDRSTAAHSTIQIEDEDSAEVWGGFRVGRRVVPAVSFLSSHGECFELEAEHKGYLHLPSKALHQRRFKWFDGKLQVEDSIKVKKPIRVVSRWHIAPDWCPEIISEELILLKFSDQIVRMDFKGGKITVNHRPSYRYLGKIENRSVINLTFDLEVGVNYSKVEIRKP